MCLFLSYRRNHVESRSEGCLERSGDRRFTVWPTVMTIVTKRCCKFVVLYVCLLSWGSNRSQIRGLCYCCYWQLRANKQSSSRYILRIPHSVDISITTITPQSWTCCFVLELVASSEQYSDAYVSQHYNVVVLVNQSKSGTTYICQLTAI